MLPLPHAHPVAGAHHRLKRCLQRRALLKAAGRKQRHRSRITPHLLIHHLRMAEGRLHLRQQLLHQGINDLLIALLSNGTGVVEVAGDH